MTALGLSFGISLPGAPDLATWRERVLRVEASGFDSLWMSDHLAGGGLAPFPALAVAAELTHELRLGTLVLNVDQVNPVVLAREATSMAVLTEGRFVLGIGAGNRALDHQVAGFSFDPPSVRVDRLTETVQLLRLLWSGESVDFRGRFHQATADASRATEVSVPLLIGGNGSRVLSLAARHADVVGFVGVSPDRSGLTARPTHLTRDGLDRLSALVDSAAQGRAAPVRRSVLVQQVTITDDRRSAAAEVQSWLPGAEIEDLLDSPYLLLGTVSHLHEQLLELRERWGIAEVVVLGSSLGAMEQVLGAS